MNENINYFANLTWAQRGIHPEMGGTSVENHLGILGRRADANLKPNTTYKGQFDGNFPL